MQDKRQGLPWWHALPPLLVVGGVGGLLVLESSTPWAPGSHHLAWPGMAVLLEGVVLYCRWCARAAHGRTAAHRPQARAQSLCTAPRGDDALWEEARWDAQGNGHRPAPSRWRPAGGGAGEDLLG
jgi:hypothetical protein